VGSVVQIKMKKEWVFEEVAVECYAGYKGGETPRAFIYQNRRFENLEVMDRWYEGGIDPCGVAHNYFKVKTSDEEIFLLRYTPRFQSWTVCRQVPKPHFWDN
jgi:hypothetical protein